MINNLSKSYIYRCKDASEKEAIHIHVDKYNDFHHVDLLSDGTLLDLKDDKRLIFNYLILSDEITCSDSYFIFNLSDSRTINSKNESDKSSQDTYNHLQSIQDLILITSLNFTPVLDTINSFTDYLKDSHNIIYVSTKVDNYVYYKVLVINDDSYYINEYLNSDCVVRSGIIKYDINELSVFDIINTKLITEDDEAVDHHILLNQVDFITVPERKFNDNNLKRLAIQVRKILHYTYNDGKQDEINIKIIYNHYHWYILFHNVDNHTLELFRFTLTDRILIDLSFPLCIYRYNNDDPDWNYEKVMNHILYNLPIIVKNPSERIED